MRFTYQMYQFIICMSELLNNGIVLNTEVIPASSTRKYRKTVETIKYRNTIYLYEKLVDETNHHTEEYIVKGGYVINVRLDGHKWLF
jgi:hypothetical protein